MSENSHHVVIVEDDESIGATMVESLTGHGYRVDWCKTGAMAKLFLESLKPDLVLLDAGLPDADGVSVCRWLRTRYFDVPIVLCTARDSEIDIIVGLDSGATDYITKPFSLNVLLARVRAHLRGVALLDPSAIVTIGDLLVNPQARTVCVGLTPVDIRSREFDLLLVLCRNLDRVLTREKLLADIWEVHWESSSKTLEMHVLALRRKLGSAIEIVTVRGIGYRLVTP